MRTFPCPNADIYAPELGYISEFMIVRIINEAWYESARCIPGDAAPLENGKRFENIFYFHPANNKYIYTRKILSL